MVLNKMAKGGCSNESALHLSFPFGVKRRCHGDVTCLHTLYCALKEINMSDYSFLSCSDEFRTNDQFELDNYGVKFVGILDSIRTVGDPNPEYVFFLSAFRHKFFFFF